jgi:hypothetical protein
MAANPSQKGALPYADEAAFGETSTTYDERLPVANNVNEIIAGLAKDKIEVPLTQQYNNEARLDAQGPYAASFPVDVFLAGHGSTCAGAVSATVVPTFLGRCFGQVNQGETGTTVDTPTSAVQWSNVGGTVVAGALIRLGAIAEARGNGEFYVVNNASTMTVLNAAADTPNAADVVYGAETVHCNETLASVTTMRFNAQTDNQKYGVHGCFATGLEISGIGVGEVPRARVQMTGARFAEESASTWPTDVASENFIPAVCTAGNVFVQTVGTTTRAMRQVRNLRISFEVETFPQMGYDSDNADQTLVGVRRGRVVPTITWQEDAEAAGTNTLYDMYAAANLKHIMVSLSCADGSAMGFYLSNAKMISPRPVQNDVDGLNQVEASFKGMTGPTSTSELIHSAWRLGFA